MNFLESLENELPESEINSLGKALEKERVHCLLLNQEKITKEEFLSFYPNVKPHPFIDGAYFYSKEEYDLGKSLLYDLGAFSIQDSAAMMVPFLLGPKPGERVLDLCAAPGGKTIFASLMMENSGVILSNDLSYPRAKDLSQNIERMGRGNIAVCSNDFSKIYQGYLGYFDKIVLDAPCSGSAMFRKLEAAKEDWSYEKVLRCASIQKELLEIAGEMLAPGGTLAYSTCSFSKEENEENIADFLSRNPNFKAINPSMDSPLFVHDHLVKEGIHLYPHRFPGEGQYLCLLQKEGEYKTHEAQILKNNKGIEDLLKTYKLEGRSNVKVNGVYYSLTESLNIKKLNLLRYGIRLIEDCDHALPEFALARALPSSFCLSLNSRQAEAYLKGETFALKEKNGVWPVCYKSFSLGFIKLVNGIAKNHYPKGLRHAYKISA